MNGKWSENELPFKNENVKYFHCVSKYPHTKKEGYDLLPRQFNETLIGYSDHTIGNDVCEEAILRGAKIIEKHFTIDHGLQSDTEGAHTCSMNMEQLIELRNFCEKVNV